VKKKTCQNKLCGKLFSVRLKAAHRKYCYFCNAVKVWENINRERANFLRKRWAKNNPTKARLRYRRHRLKTKYGLTLEELKNLEKEQKHRCAICKKRFNGRWKRPNVDHKHGKEGTHRGLLCVDCNLLIGHAFDDIKILSKAIIYLRYWEK
jgi:Recombination endonuclease VII